MARPRLINALSRSVRSTSGMISSSITRTTNASLRGFLKRGSGCAAQIGCARSGTTHSYAQRRWKVDDCVAAPAVTATGMRNGPRPSAMSSLAVGRGTEECIDGNECGGLSAAEVEDLFYNSVCARTVSNAQLRKYLSGLKPGEHAVALAAVKGARRAGLRLNALTYEVLLAKLIESGQLKASLALHDEAMRSHHVLPTPRAYSLLMELCLFRGSPESCEKLFSDMRKKGTRPTISNYELLISSYAETTPPQWEKAIQVFDRVKTQRFLHPSAKTYNALLRVYLNMRPFDWRVAYNCYYELRHHDPPIPLEWESYLLVSEALRKGHAGYFRRVSTFCDAWLTTTPMFTVRWMKGVAVYLLAMLLLKSVIGSILTVFLAAKEDEAHKRDGETVIGARM